MLNSRRELMSVMIQTVILTAAAFVTASLFLFLALLVVCRGFAISNNDGPEPYELRLWAKYNRGLTPEVKKAA